MCTVTYLPTPTGYLLTSSRDESTQRARAVFPVRQPVGDATILMPQDPEGGGSWIATNEQGNTACLLNGAFENHHRQPPYRKSRGLVLLDSFQFSTTEAFLRHYDFEGIEPFTLILASVNAETQLYQIRWDGHRVHHDIGDPSQPHIWSSVTLYDTAMRQKRNTWFQQWLSRKPAFTAENIMNFHIAGGEGNPDIDFKMKRGDFLQTMSLSCIEIMTGSGRFIYLDFLLNKTQKISF